MKYIIKYCSFFYLAILLINHNSCIKSDQSKIPGKKHRYEARWESVTQHPYPEWFRDAKFGIYTHWGLYSVPAFETEWYSHWMYVKGHKVNKYHLEKYGPLSEFGYKDFIPMFTSEKFNADAWADLFKKAGARFAGPVAEHADGFAMWDSKLTKWDVADVGPKRDVVGEMEKAVRKAGMKFIISLHHQWLYAWYPTMDKSTDASNPEYEDLYGPAVPSEAFEMAVKNPAYLPDEKFCNRWLSRAIEAIDKYKPDLVWFDNKLNILDDKYLLEFLSHYYNKAQQWNKEVVVTYKFTDLKTGAGILDLERSRMSTKKEFPWLTDDSIDWRAWCDIQNPDYKSTNRLIDFLVDVVSKNGCLLLNVTPKANGEIPQPVKERLLEMGKWLEINGEAIYETRPWKICGEGPTKILEGHLSERENVDLTAEDIRFTTKDNTLYAFVLDWPGESLTIPSLGFNRKLFTNKIKSIQLLGLNEKLEWKHSNDNLIIQLPEQKSGQYAFVFKILSVKN